MTPERQKALELAKKSIVECSAGLAERPCPQCELARELIAAESELTTLRDQLLVAREALEEIRRRSIPSGEDYGDSVTSALCRVALSAIQTPAEKEKP